MYIYIYFVSTTNKYASYYAPVCTVAVCFSPRVSVWEHLFVSFFFPLPSTLKPPPTAGHVTHTNSRRTDVK